MGLVGRSFLANYGGNAWHWLIILALLASLGSKCVIYAPDGDMYVEGTGQLAAVRWVVND